jgi:predicted permease
VDVWVPLTLNRAAQPMNAHFYETVARLRPGVTIESAEREAMQLASLFPTELAAAYGGSFVDDSGFSTELIPLRDDVVGPASTRLWVVFGAVGVVLLIACANVANLFLVRAESRRREVAVRNALGASRRALVRQFLAESMLIAIASGILAIVLAELGVRLLLAISPSGIPRLDEVEVRGPTILFTAFIALVSGYVFGLFPLLGGMRQAGPESLIDGTGRTTTGRARMQLRGALVIAQVALSLVLLAGAGLLLRSARSLWAMDAGFESAGLLTFQVSLPRVNYPDHLAIHRFHERLSTELRDLPGVVGVGAVTHLPMAGARTCFALGPVDGTRASDAVSPCTDIALISPGWLEAMEIPVRGRAFTAQDNENPTGGVLVTEALAAQFWPGVDPVGRRIQYSGLELTVTGVTGDIRQHGLAEPVVPQVFFPIVPPPAGSQWFAPASMTVVVRASHPDPATLLPGVRAGLARVDGEIPVASVRTMEQVVADSLADRSFILLMLAIAAILALALGTIGLYGVIAYVVAQRRAEIGIRIALGARPGAVGAMVVRQAMVLASAGVAIGIACALAGSRVLQSMLFAVSASDPLTIAAASALLLFVSAAAACGPARKASRIDPVEMMRSG